MIFFQNENPYEVPSQSAWMSSSTQDGYPAFYIPASVTSFQGYGMGSYSFFDQGVAIENAMAFQAPDTSGVSTPHWSWTDSSPKFEHGAVLCSGGGCVAMERALAIGGGRHGGAVGVECEGPAPAMDGD